MKRVLLAFVCLFAVGLFFAIGSGSKASKKVENNAVVSQSIVIAGLFGGGGLDATVPFRHDYVILLNRSDSPVSLDGWSTQYASRTGSNWLVTELTNVTLQPGQYYLIQYASNGSGGANLPTPDLIAPNAPGENFIPNLSSTAGKLALVSSTAQLPAESCPSSSSIVDLVGYGSAANCFEGTQTPNINRNQELTRADNGCEDTDVNADDFSLVTANPKNTATTFNPCNFTSKLQATGGADPNTVAPGDSTLLTVAVTPASSPPSTGITVSGNLSEIGGNASQSFFDDGTNGDVTAGDNIFSYTATLPEMIDGGARTLNIGVADAQARSTSTTINITVNAPLPGDNPLELGNPSNATSDAANENNYLINRPQYSLSYNRANATPNWVAWRLDSTWVGSAPRQDDYRPDTSLPSGWYQVQDDDYSGSGYTRGHVCPSGDRTRTVADNSATFLMTNFFPQIAENNGGAWLDFEVYLRNLANQGKEIYIFAGGHGSLGRIANGQVNVPEVTWKVAVVLDIGSNDLQRIGKGTRTIAIVVPNSTPLNQGAPWRQFRTSVHAVETLTGHDFLSNVPRMTQEIIERRRDIQ